MSGRPEAVQEHLELHGTLEWTGRVPVREGLAAYVHLVRAPEDPEERRVGRGATSWRELERLEVAEARAALLEVLADGRARTFNALGVEAWGRTADVLFGTPADTALWQLLEDGLVERTTRAPIRWRLSP